jgi:excisionase family DNA binding protein
MLAVAHVLKYCRSVEATNSYPNLLSEKQAAKRLGIARITLLRERKAGHIRFFRIGTRVLYCAEHLTAFLNVVSGTVLAIKLAEDADRTPANEEENLVSSAECA